MDFAEGLIKKKSPTQKLRDIAVQSIVTLSVTALFAFASSEAIPDHTTELLSSSPSPSINYRK